MSEIEKPSFETLLDWLEERLEPEQAVKVASWAAQAGPEFLKDVEWARTFLQTAAAGRRQALLAVPPASVRHNLKAAFKEQQRQSPGLLQRFLAALSFDSHNQWAAAGVRSSGMADNQRQLIYQTEAGEIALNIQARPEDKLVTLYGQYFPTPGNLRFGQIVQAVRQAEQVSITWTDELGEFVLPALQQGEYMLVLSNDQFEVYIEDLSLTL